MRRLIATAFFCLALPAAVVAKPSDYPRDSFSGDRWVVVAQGASAVDVTRAVRCPPPACGRAVAKPKKMKRRWRDNRANYAVAQREKAREVITDLLAGAKVYVRSEGAPVVDGPKPKTLIRGLTEEIAGAFSAPRFIKGRLVCAVNVNAALQARGIKGTGSALAKSYLSWGRSSGPVPGAVAVFSRGKRGGHVALVAGVRPDGTVLYLNPSSRKQAWVVGPYGRRPIAFRVAG